LLLMLFDLEDLIFLLGPKPKATYICIMETVNKIEKTMADKIKVCDALQYDPSEKPLLIAGPCVLQSRDVAFRIAEEILEIVNRTDVPFMFKSSFDKANRTSAQSKRGPGLSEGLKILDEIKNEFNVPVITDVHETGQIDEVAEVADAIQIPAFLCRQTDLLIACGRSGKTVNVKKGQFLSPEDMKFAREKVLEGGDVTVFQTERGATFGYRDLVVDLRSLYTMRQFGPVIFDGTHAVQSPGGAGGKTGGNRELVPLLVRGALAAGIDGLFLEVHYDPDSSPSDGPNMIYPETLKKHLPMWLDIHQRVQEEL